MPGEFDRPSHGIAPKYATDPHILNDVFFSASKSIDQYSTPEWR